MEVVQGRQAQCLQVTHWDGHSQGIRDLGSGASGRCLQSCLFFGKQGEPGVTEAAAPGLIQVAKRINNSFTDWMVL